jgi:hypothetical protein
VAGNQIPATKEPWVYTAQLYLLPDDGASIDTSGIEQAAPIVRMVTGGTGKFRNVAGVQRHEFLGFNKLGGVKLQVRFVLREVDSGECCLAARVGVIRLARHHLVAREPPMRANAGPRRCNADLHCTGSETGVGALR